MNKLLRSGEIYYADLGSIAAENKTAVGAEIGKNRPCIVVKHYIQLKLVTIIPLTSLSNDNQWLLSLATVFLLQKGTANLPNESVALCHQIRSIAVERIGNKIGKLDELTQDNIATILVDMFAR